MSAQNEILLESGTNELGVLEFIIDGNSFGINVAKIKDLMRYEKVQLMPRSHPNIEGIFQPRDIVYPVIDLAGYLGLAPSKDPEHDILIITAFNQQEIAFHVHAVESISRISWSKIEKPDASIYGGGDGIVTGIARLTPEKLVLIIDFEKIVYDIAPNTGIQLSEVDALGQRDPSKVPILIAEDSILLRRMLLDALHQAGYTNVTSTDNGKEAWETLQGFAKSEKSVNEQCALVITDIEMPQMDGHRLLKLIRSDVALRHLPVLVFSSLINDEMRRKGESLGATAQLSKPEIGNLIMLIDKYLPE